MTASVHRRPISDDDQEVLAQSVSEAIKAYERFLHRRSRSWIRSHDRELPRWFKSTALDRIEFKEIVKEPSSEPSAVLFAALVDRHLTIRTEVKRTSTIRTFVTTTSLGSRETAKIVIHYGHRADFLGDLGPADYDFNAAIVPQAVLAVPGSDQMVSLRGLVHTTLADELGKFDRETPSHASLEKRISVLRQVLDGLEALHGTNRLHGDLRPENITIGRNGAAALADYLLMPPYERLTAEQSAYIAPEMPRATPGRPSDVYAFGVLAQRLLGAYLWDSRQLPTSLNTDAFEWVLDFCTLENPSDRPSVAELRSLLFDGKDAVLGGRAMANVRKARQRAVTHLSDWMGTNGYQADYVADAVSGAAHQVESLQARFPETALALLSPARAVRLVSRYALDSSLRGIHNQAQIAAPSSDEIRTPEVARPEDTTIDLPLRDRLHRLHFDKPITFDHDRRMPRIWRGSKLAKRQREYLEHVDRVEEARMTILSMDDFYYTSGVSELLAGPAGKPSDADIATLRRWQHILALPDHGRWLYPSFQFVPGQPAISPLVELANERFENSNAWEITSWWLMPRPSLNGASLASVIHAHGGADQILYALDRDAPKR